LSADTDSGGPCSEALGSRGFFRVKFNSMLTEPRWKSWSRRLLKSPLGSTNLGGPGEGQSKERARRAVFFHRLGEVRDRAYENQRYGASGLNLVIAAIVLWNTVYQGRAATAPRAVQPVDGDLLRHVAPLGWNHIAITGDYSWHANKRVAKGGYRPMRRVRPAESMIRAPQRT
jgi:hypothetical protein